MKVLFLFLQNFLYTAKIYSISRGLIHCKAIFKDWTNGILSTDDLENYARILKSLKNKWVYHIIQKDTTYIFIFLGEFGYEVFNWQGVVRKFARKLPQSSKIVIAGRKGLEQWYESASEYIDISEFELYKNSIAAAYFSLPPNQLGRSMPPSTNELKFDYKIRKSLRSYILRRIHLKNKKCQFIFSSHLSAFPGCIFGVNRFFYGRPDHPGKIYGTYDLANNNEFRRILPNIKVKKEIEKKLRFSLNNPFVLLQSRNRYIGPNYGSKLPDNLLIDELTKHVPVIFLSFKTGRYLDSSSSTETRNRGVLYHTNSFHHQSCLIHFARKCIFLSERDLGSHTYLPPFMGKDVVVIASKEIFNLPSASIRYWNKNIFRFGGQMIPIQAEEIFASSKKLKSFVGKLLS